MSTKLTIFIILVLATSALPSTRLILLHSKPINFSSANDRPLSHVLAAVYKHQAVTKLYFGRQITKPQWRHARNSMTNLKEPGMKDLRLQAYGTMIEKHMIMMICRNKAKGHTRRHSYLCTRINELCEKRKHASFNKHYWQNTASMAKNACGFNGRL